jgi:hypothetical protein
MHSNCHAACGARALTTIGQAPFPTACTNNFLCHVEYYFNEGREALLGSWLVDLLSEGLRLDLQCSGMQLHPWRTIWDGAQAFLAARKVPLHVSLKRASQRCGQGLYDCASSFLTCLHAEIRALMWLDPYESLV